MKAFKSPARWLDDIDADAAALLIMAAADMAVVLDQRGVVRDYAFQSEALALEFAGQESWLEQPWRDSVTIESRPKIDDMIRDVQAKPPRNGRQVNYPSTSGGNDIPILFSVFPVGKTNRLMAIGRDLRSFAALQQRVVDVQQSFERDYARMRHIETRYRILFQMIPEPVLIVDATTQKIVEANPAARRLAGPNAKIVGHSVGVLMSEDNRPAVEALLAKVRAEGRADDIAMHFPGAAGDMSASALSFHQDGSRLVLIRLAMDGTPAGGFLTENKERMLKLVEQGPDGFVATDQNGLVIAANETFLEMAQLRNEAQARGVSLDRWLGRPGVDVDVLLNSLRQHETVRLFSTVLRDEFGVESEVEVSAAAVRNGGTPSMGFAIRAVARRSAPPATATRTLPKSIEQMTQLIGRVSLKELVREATDVIELLCIQAALTMSSDNKASAAEILGVSRQSLYVKMRRHGLIEAQVVDAE